MRSTSCSSLRSVAVAAVTVGLALCGACSEPPPSVSTEQALLPQAKAAGPGQPTKVEYLGDGCSESDAKFALSPDGEAFTVTFSNFLAAAGPVQEPGQAVRGCLLRVGVQVPAGWSYALRSVDTRGYAALDEGVSATRSPLIYIEGTSPQLPPPSRLEGKLDDDFEARDLGDDSKLRFSPCGQARELFLATTVAVEPGKAGGSGVVNVDSIDGELAWRRCK
jgi:hypothetical protein